MTATTKTLTSRLTNAARKTAQMCNASLARYEYETALVRGLGLLELVIAPVAFVVIFVRG